MTWCTSYLIMKRRCFFVFLKYPARNSNIYQKWAIFFEPVSSPLPKHECMVSMFSFWMFLGVYPERIHKARGPGVKNMAPPAACALSF